MSEMTIAKLARAGGVGVETIRYYQRRGLLREPARPLGSGHGDAFRQYEDSDLRRVRFIKTAQAAGFTLDEIGDLIRLDAMDDRATARDMALSRIAALDTKIADLLAARDALKVLAGKCAKRTPGPCPILTAFDPPELGS